VREPHELGGHLVRLPLDPALVEGAQRAQGRDDRLVPGRLLGDEQVEAAAGRPEEEEVVVAEPEERRVQPP